MDTNSQRTPYRRSVLEFKSSSFTVPVLVLADNNLNAITEQLKIKIQQAPEFFRNSPIIIDLHKLQEKKVEIKLEDLIAVMRELNFQTIGIRGESEKQKADAKKMNIALLVDRRSTADITISQESKKIPSPSSEELEEPEELEEQPNESLMVNHPIRSGQRVYSSADLIITSSVSPGAEIMAEGNIHVYGALRGRALAGVKGNENCRIFCSDLQAELVSIAGNFKVSEDMDDSVRGKPIQISFQDQKFQFKEL